MLSFQFVGADVSKDKFDVAQLKNNKYQQKCFSNNKKGYRDFLKWLNTHCERPWVCMEATGHYSELIAEFLVKHSIRVSVVNPLQIKSYAKAKLARNKNDQIDAQVIADYCEKMKPREFNPRTDSQKELKDLNKLLDTLKEQLVRFKNQLAVTQGKLARKAMQKLIKDLEKQIKEIEKQSGNLIKNNEDMAENMALMISIKGVGEATAHKILAQIADITRFDNAKQFAAYLGISPKQHQSGKYIGRTTISRLGDSCLRKALYMAALVAKRYNEALQPFVKRLEERGKAPKAIVCAVMRKLAHIIFGVLRNKEMFNPQLV